MLPLPADRAAAAAAPDDPLRQQAARAYQHAARRRGWYARAVSVAAVLAAAAGAGRVASLVSGPAAQSILVAVFAFGLLEAVSLPFAVFGWRASRRVGLSRQAPAGWTVDHAKGLVLGALLIVPAAVVVTLLERRAPSAWPLLLWLAATLLSLLVTIVAPVVILPLFLRAERLESGGLWQMTRDVCARAGVVVDDVRLLVMSEKTSGANAAVVGIGPTRRILLGDTLVDTDDLAETRAVLAHELGHHKHHDMWRGLAVETLTSLVAFLAAAFALARLPTSVAHHGAPHPASLVALAACVAACRVPLSLIGACQSRRQERRADAFAFRVESGASFARAMERLVVSNLAELWPPPFERVFASHPPPGDRIAAAWGSAPGRVLLQESPGKPRTES